jgi:hypothetical protein
MRAELALVLVLATTISGCTSPSTPVTVTATETRNVTVTATPTMAPADVSATYVRNLFNESIIALKVLNTYLQTGTDALDDHDYDTALWATGRGLNETVRFLEYLNVSAQAPPTQETQRFHGLAVDYWIAHYRYMRLAQDCITHDSDGRLHSQACEDWQEFDSTRIDADFRAEADRWRFRV